MRSLALVFLLSSFAYADLSTEELFNMSLDELLNVNVTSASKKSQSLLDSPSAIEIITKEELEILKCNRLSECLEFATGMSSVNGEGNIFSTTTIRGNTQVNYNTNTLLLVDGIPILNSYHGSFNLDMMPLSSIERIEIVKGANSVLYGTNAINGVINIITIDDNDEIMGRARYGSYNTQHLEARTVHNYDNGSLRLFADRTSSNEDSFLIHDEKGEFRDFAQDYETDALMAKASYDDAWMHLQFYDRHLHNYKTRGFSVNGVDAKEKNTEKEYLIALGYDYEVDKDFSLNMKSVYHDWELEKDRYIGHWDYSSWSSYNELELHMFDNAKSSNIFGVSYEVGAARRYKSEKGAYDVGASNQKTHNYSVYDNGNFALNESWNFVYGGRYFFSDYYDRLEREDVHNDNFSVRTGVLYSVQNNMTLKTLYSQAYRVPTYFEKEVNSATVKGNPNLSSEKSESYDLIFVHQLESFNYTADLFYTKIKDKISRVDIGGGIKQNKNDGDIDYYGLELNTKFRIDETLWGFAGYSYTQSANEDNKALEDFVYDNMFTAALSKKAFSDFTFNTAIKYMDSWAEADSCFLMNLSADYAVPSVQGLSFELIATNIFNEDIDVPEIARDAPEVETVPEDQSSRFYFGMKYLF